MPNLRQSVAWKRAKRMVLDPLRRIPANLSCRGRVPLVWSEGRYRGNWGDALSPVLAGLLSEKQVIQCNRSYQNRYSAIGSILGRANENTEVWGSGFICENQSLFGKPRVVHAVRGPLSRALLLEQGVDCPEVYGDPALLLPYFFNPEIDKQYAVGIVPHYVDKGHPWLEQFRNNPQVLVIDIECGIRQFVRSVKSCDVILSSSLHGLICADSYDVPSIWVQFSENIIGGDYKFRDYYLSIGAGEPRSIQIAENTQLANVVARAQHRDINLDLQKLALACPFLSEKHRLSFQSLTNINPVCPVRGRWRVYVESGRYRKIGITSPANIYCAGRWWR